MAKWNLECSCVDHRFKVGDEVVTYTPVIVCGEYAGRTGVIIELLPDDQGEQAVIIDYGGPTQTSYVKTDNLELAEEPDAIPTLKRAYESYKDFFGKPDGGPAGYYDLPRDRPMKTLNDVLEWKGDTQWLGDSFHLANVTKAGWRWGIKDGTSKTYDARKFIYSGARLLMKYAGVKELRKTLQKMLDDPQFQVREHEQ